jgi:multisubunit Na+/H+ antiporter MnhC subunit
MDSEGFGALAWVLSFSGGFAALGFGVYLFIKGDITRGLLALILSCLAFNLFIQLNKT